MDGCRCCEDRGHQRNVGRWRFVEVDARRNLNVDPKQRDQPRQFQERISRSLDEAISEARGRVGKLEVAINALGEDDPAVTRLKEALRKARLQASAPCGRSYATKMFIERSKKRVDSVREEITKTQEAGNTSQVHQTGGKRWRMD